MLRTRLTLSVFTFLLTSLLFLSIPLESYSGTATIGPICCIVGDSCGGCESGCSIPSSECAILGGDGQKEAYCVDNGSGASCEDPSGDGCCVIAEDDCVSSLEYATCAFDEGGTYWFQGSDCSEISQCSAAPGPQSNTTIPTLNEWGLIIITALLGIAGLLVIRKRRASA